LQEDKNQKNAAEAEVVKLIGIIPSINKMDGSLAALAKVKSVTL
jgi:hypothetical protein